MKQNIHLGRLTVGGPAPGPLEPAPAPAPHLAAGSAVPDLSAGGHEQDGQAQPEMTSSTVALLELLRQPRQYAVPIYQRGYCWGELQWAQLLDHVLAATRGRQRYTGVMAYVVPTGDTGDTSSVSLLDGQQRLVTVLLLLTVMIWSLQQAGDGEIGAAPVTTETLRRLLGTSAGSGNERLTVLPYRAQERDTLAWLIGRLDDAGLPGPPAPAPAMLEAVACFEERVAASGVATIYAGLERLEVSCLVVPEGAAGLDRLVQTLNRG